MSEQNPTNELSALAERASSSCEWWKENAMGQRSELALPTRVLVTLENAGIYTVEQLKAAGPARLRKLPNIGALAFQQIVDLLRALDREANGGDTDA